MMLEWIRGYNLNGVDLRGLTECMYQCINNQLLFIVATLSLDDTIKFFQCLLLF